MAVEFAMIRINYLLDLCLDMGSFVSSVYRRETWSRKTKVTWRIAAVSKGFECNYRARDLAALIRRHGAFRRLCSISPSTTFHPWEQCGQLDLL